MKKIKLGLNFFKKTYDNVADLMSLKPPSETLSVSEMSLKPLSETLYVSEMSLKPLKCL